MCVLLIFQIGLASAESINLDLTAASNLVREPRSKNCVFVQSGSVQTFTKMDTRCHLCTVFLNQCASAFLFLYFKRILGFINLLKFSPVCLLLANRRFFFFFVKNAASV